MTTTMNSEIATYRTKQEASVVRERKQITLDKELKRIYNRDGVLTPEAVLVDAVRETSKLHKYFEWDDSVAGERYRLIQARNMLMASKFVVVLNERHEAMAAKPPTLVRAILPAVRGEGFRMRNEVLNEAESRAALVAAKRGALRAWCSSVCDISELNGLRQMIEQHLQ